MESEHGFHESGFPQFSSGFGLEKALERLWVELCLLRATNRRLTNLSLPWEARGSEGFGSSERAKAGPFLSKTYLLLGLKSKQRSKAGQSQRSGMGTASLFHMGLGHR